MPSWAPTSTPLNASSSRMTLASCAKARAMKTRWRWPPESSVTRAERCSHKLTRSRQTWTISLSCLLGCRNHAMLRPRPIVTTSSTVAGKTQLMLSRWGTYASAPLWAAAPRRLTLPSVLARSPAMASNSVLLPAPFGPKTPIRVPGPTSKETLLSAVCPPRTTVKFSTVMPVSEAIVTNSYPPASF